MTSGIPDINVIPGLTGYLTAKLMNRIVLNETSYYGAGCRVAIADEIKKRGFRKVLLVTDKPLIQFGVAAKIEAVLNDAGIPYEIYSEINPTIRKVLEGLAAS